MLSSMPKHTEWECANKPEPASWTLNPELLATLTPGHALLCFQLFQLNW